MNTPNLITILRLAAVPVIVYFLYLPYVWAKSVALGLFVAAMLSDVVDGLIARNRRMITNFGIFLDPIADKILILSMLFVLASLRVFSFWIPLIILWRELLVNGVRSIASSHGQVIGANWMGKTKAAFQTATIVAGLLMLIVQSKKWLAGGQLDAGSLTISLLAIATAVLSVIFALIFVYWNRTLLFKNV